MRYSKRSDILVYRELFASGCSHHAVGVWLSWLSHMVVKKGRGGDSL